ncbi:hypothetical protein [Janthinobacterium fluminis]|uniref:Pilus assembly protein n=1 Tax=Janthinobacterium fluminis TaxID=2987524 RepID=A0ABT5JZ77_9BURK|nr:hypothetical protein [Janthinobacterium fluminis]MDC8758026.1 hypothetical protein [Janthinobacterium fluminis]
MRPRHLPHAALLCAIALAGCAPATPNLDRQFGHSVRLAMARQTLHPDAGARAQRDAGLDARAALGAYERYQQSNQTPEAQPNVLTIGVGGR